MDIIKYSGAYKIGDIVTYRGHECVHECVVVETWVDVDNGKNGIRVKPTGDYGFEIDIYEEQLLP